MPRNSLKRIALVDMDKLRLLMYDGKVLRGECNRCGKCCRAIKQGKGCEYLQVEMVDDKPRHFCSIYFERPARCALWPMFGDPVPDGCGFWWEVL